MTQRGFYDRSVYDLEGHMKAADAASPDTFVRRSLKRTDINSAAGIALPTTGKLVVVPMPLEAGETVTSFGWVTGTTAAATPTAGFVALYNPSGVLLGQSADFAATARAASTAYTSALAAPQVAKVSGIHYAVLCITAGTMPTVLGTPVAPAIASGESSYARESSATYTGTAPANLPALVARVECPYIVAI